jgi:hypothetical protein
MRMLMVLLGGNDWQRFFATAANKCRWFFSQVVGTKIVVFHLLTENVGRIYTPKLKNVKVIAQISG